MIYGGATSDGYVSIDDLGLVLANLQKTTFPLTVNHEQFSVTSTATNQGRHD